MSLPEPDCWAKFLGSYPDPSGFSVQCELGLVFSSDKELRVCILQPYSGGPRHPDVLRMCQKRIFPYLAKVLGVLAEDLDLGVLPTSVTSNVSYTPPRTERSPFDSDSYLESWWPWTLWPSTGFQTVYTPAQWSWTEQHRTARVFLKGQALTRGQVQSLLGKQPGRPEGGSNPGS